MILRLKHFPFSTTNILKCISWDSLVISNKNPLCRTSKKRLLARPSDSLQNGRKMAGSASVWWEPRSTPETWVTGRRGHLDIWGQNLVWIGCISLAWQATSDCTGKGKILWFTVLTRLRLGGVKPPMQNMGAGTQGGKDTGPAKWHLSILSGSHLCLFSVKPNAN